MYEVVTPWLAEQAPDPSTWDPQFDRWEFLLGLIALDISRGSGEGGWGPVGRFSWRNRHGGGITDEILREIENPETWPPVRGGLFGTNGDRLAVSATAYLQLVGRARNSQW
jgi:hypothetical protein